MASESKRNRREFIANSSLLETFWSLAEGKEEARTEAISRMVNVLSSSQKKPNTISGEIEYSLSRLLKGLSSNRKYARLGFTVALTQFLREFEAVKMSDVLRQIKESLSTKNTESKSELSNVLLGRVMAYLALIQSDRITQATEDELINITKDILKMRQEKLPLHQICTQCLQQLNNKISEEDFTDTVWPLLTEELSVGWNECKPDTLSLLMATQEQHKSAISKKFLSEHWNEKQLICEKNFENIAKVFSSSTGDHPIVHPVCFEIVTTAAAKPQLFSGFWKKVIDDKLIMQPMPKKYLCFQLVPYALKHCVNTDMIKTVLSNNILHHFIKNLSHKDQPLNSAAKQLAHDLVEFVSQCQDGSQQVAVLCCLLQPPSSIMFDVVTKTRTITNMVSKLNVAGTREFSEILMKIVRGENVLQSTQDLDVQRRWAIQHLGSMVTLVSMAAEEEMQQKKLQFLFLHAFFDIKEASDSLLHCDEINTAEFSKSSRQGMQDAFFKSLNRLATFCPNKEMAGDQRPYIGALYEVVKYADNLLKHPEVVSPITPFEEEEQEAWDKMVKTVGKLHGKNVGDAKMSDTLAFELLFLHLGLQLFTDPKSACDVFDDLHVCYEKATKNKRRSSVMKKPNLDEPEWVDVITELLLSLLSQQSHLLRVVVKTVFGMLSPHMTPTALQLILDVLKEGASDEEGALAFEDEGMEDVEEEEEKSSAEETAANENEESSDESSDDSSDEENVDEEVKRNLKNALGKAAVESDDEESSDLDDDAMFKLDDALANVFRSMKKSKKDNKEKETQLKHFKIRCIDLLETFIHHTSSTEMLLKLVDPLLAIMESSTKEKNMKELGDKATHVFNFLCKPRKLAPDTSFEKGSLPEKVKELVDYSKKVSGIPMARSVATACVFMTRVMLGMEANTGPSPMRTRSRSTTKVTHKETQQERDSQNLETVIETITEAVRNFCEKRDSNLSPMFFHTIFERQPTLMWPIAESLLDLGMDINIRIYCRTQVFSMLAAMISKKTAQDIGEDSWNEFRSSLVAKVNQSLSDMGKESLKFKYIHEMLLVLHKTLVASDAEFKGGVSKDLLEKIDGLRKNLNKDGKVVCNKILGMLEYRSNNSHQKQSKKRSKAQEKTNGEHEEDTDNSPKKKMKNAENGTDSLKSNGLPETPKSQKKKKKRTMSASSDNLAIQNETPQTPSSDSAAKQTPKSQSGKKLKRKSKGGLENSDLNTSQQSGISSTPNGKKKSKK